MAVQGTITKNYEFESNRIVVTHTSDALRKVYLYERGQSGNSLQFTIDKLDDVIDVLLALQGAVR